MLLQGRRKLLCNLYEIVKGFDGKLSLFKVHAQSSNFLHFRFTREVCCKEEVCTEDTKQVLVGVLDSLQTDFNKRFINFASINDVCCFFAGPFTSRPDVCHKLSQTFGVDEAVLQEDFIDIKIVPGLKEQFLTAKDNLVLFWVTKVLVRFLALHEVVQKFLVFFVSMWSCESGFSTMNHIKNSIRCHLTDKRLDELQ